MLVPLFQISQMPSQLPLNLGCYTVKECMLFLCVLNALLFGEKQKKWDPMTSNHKLAHSGMVEKEKKIQDSFSFKLQKCNGI